MANAGVNAGANASANGAGNLSLFALGTALLRHRWRIALFGLLGGVIAAALVWSAPALYPAAASFVPQGADTRTSGLANLAGQFGVAIPGSSQSLTPDFYTRLLRSRVLLRRVVNDTFTVPELGGRRVSFYQLFDITNGAPLEKEEAGIAKLSLALVTPQAQKTTGIVDFSVSTKWPSVSLGIIRDLLRGVNEFNQETRQGQAMSERKFIEGLLDAARTDLRSAEDRLEGFLASNRQGVNTSPELMFTRDRLQRDVMLKQQVFTSLTQAYEDARIREVRDTPVVTVVEEPSVATKPLPRGRGIRILLGLILGALVGAMPAFGAGVFGGAGRRDSRDVDEFLGALNEVKIDLLHPMRRFSRRARTGAA